MVTWSRIDKEGKEHLIKEFDTFNQAVKYFESMKDPDEPEEPRDGCWNCTHYDYKREACTIGWNNMDESYYNPDCDDRNPDDYCEEHEIDLEASWEDWIGDEKE